MIRSATHHAARVGLLIAFWTACSADDVPTGPAASPAAASMSGALEPDAEVLATFPAGQRPEGVAVDLRGRVYVGLRIPAANAFAYNRILRLDDAGHLQPVADLGPASPGAQGLLGLATDSRGTLAAAFAAGDPGRRGVYRVAPDGSSVDRWPGSAGMVFPNGLVFDAAGTLYVTDSALGAVWRCLPSAACEPWIQDLLLAPAVVPGFGVLPGANGITWQPRHGIFVANTARGLIVRIPVGAGGGPGAPTVLAAGLTGIDGLSARYDGSLLVVNAGANLLGIPAVYAVDPAAGDVTPLPIPPSAFDDPTSIAVNRGASGPRVGFVVSADLFPPTGAGPALLRIGVP